MCLGLIVYDFVNRKYKHCRKLFSKFKGMKMGQVHEDVIIEDYLRDSGGYDRNELSVYVLDEDSPTMGLIPTSNLNNDHVMLGQAITFNTPPPFIPISPRGPPDSTDFAGNCKFEVAIDSTHVHKKKYLYSAKLGRIYVDMNCDFSVSLNWEHQTVPREMYVRATVVFSAMEQKEKRVERCVQHFHERTDLPREMAKNVLNSSRELGTEGVYYCGDADVADSWYSVLLRVNKTTADACTLAYKFTCKNSCATGINRRALAIIFALEDSVGNVHGRQKVGVKVCSCPRRDMLKDEESEGVFKPGKKRVPSNQLQPSATKKKIKVETQETAPRMVPLPRILVEENALRSGLRTMIDMMTNGGLHNPSVVDTYATSIAELERVLNNLDNEPSPQ